MQKDFLTPAGHAEAVQQAGQPITVFKAEQKEYGFHIRTVGQCTLRPAVNPPDCILGTIDLDGRQIPVIKPKTRSSPQPPPLTPQSCVVLFEHRIGQVAITTGRFFEEVSRVFDLIVELSDLPARPEVFYACQEDFSSLGRFSPPEPLRTQDTH